MSQRLEVVEEKVKMMPIRLFNSATHSRAPLRYPAPFVAEPGGPLPFTRNDLECINGNDAATALGHLGLPVPDAMDDRIDALMNYLGIKIMV